MAPSVCATQQLSDLTEFIKAYKCRVYNCVFGPHERCIESTVPVRLASLTQLHPSVARPHKAFRRLA